MIPDTAWNADQFRDRGVVLYGNAESNRAWNELLAQSPIQVHRGHFVAGTKRIDGSDLGAIFVQPRPDSNVASIAVITGTGPSGMRLCDRLPYFLAGVAYPDWTLFGPKVLTEGTSGVLGAGYFGLDWALETGEYSWR